MKMVYGFVYAMLGGLAGYAAAPTVAEISWISSNVSSALVSVGAVGTGAILGLVLGPLLQLAVREAVGYLISGLNKTPTSEVISGAIGLLLGLLIAILLSIPLPEEVPLAGPYLPTVITVMMGYLGWAVGVRKRDEFLGLFPRSSDKVVPLREKKMSLPKILDTSVIIDGRILDITRSGFIEGPLIAPGFILEELQHIADSSDVLKRNRGRRGLDILNKMQKETHVNVQIGEQDYPQIQEVDTKLVRLAKDLGARILTNDYNLNKVCELQSVQVLNINELANAVKPVVLPGEELRVQVIKDGKEQGQGVAYLDDGTMIVVDSGRRYIGDSVKVVVTSVLQTAAGRMIFAKPKPMEKAL